jgi:hypothetical protein
VTPELKTIRLSEVEFDERIYPRQNHDPALVQRYAETLDQIEAAQRYIVLSPDLKILDGKHRWLGYLKRFDGQDREIQALVYPVLAPREQLRLAIKLNSDHGLQLSEEDKEQDAKELFAQDYSYDEIASALSVGKAKVTAWLARTVKEQKDRRDRTIRDFWMRCHTLEEIAAAVDCTHPTVKAIADSFVDSVLQNQTYKAAADHVVEYEPSAYNIWKQQTKSEGAKHFGNSEVRWVDHLLYHYTQSFDIVVDPFAGSGSTLDICRKRWRRCWIGDRKPIVERAHEIRRHDLVADGLPPLNKRWSEVSLVYLDPPYWRQAAGRYSEDPTDLANMPLDESNQALSGIINGFLGKLRGQNRERPGYVALIIQPTQWKADERVYTDHVLDMARLVKGGDVEMRYSAPYESQQCTAQMVEWAKANRRSLVLTREIVVWRA